MSSVIAFPEPATANNRVPIGRHPQGTLELDLDKLLAGRLLIQGSSGAGKSSTLRRIIEEAFDYVTTVIVDPEGEFDNLAQHIGATTLRATSLSAEGLTAAALRCRQHRIALHIDLSDLDPEQRIVKAAAFFAGLIGAPRETWTNTVLVCIDEGHLLAPHVAGSVRDADTRRLGVATLTDLAARGRKRGIAPIIATQRLAKLSSSVTSELQNFLVGLNVFDRDIARAADLLGYSVRDADCLRHLAPGEFIALGPALSRTAVAAHIDLTVTAHSGATPPLQAAADLTLDQAETLLDLGKLHDIAHQGRDNSLTLKGLRALDAFLLDPAGTTATRIVSTLKAISPNATTTNDLTQHIGGDADLVDRAIDLLAAIGAVDTMPRDTLRIVRLAARLRQKIADVDVVALP